MTAMIDISNAEKTFTMHLQGGVQLPVVRGVSFQVEPGECVVLSGPSGAGKSSILKMIFGNYRCDGGRIGIRHRGNLVDLASASGADFFTVSLYGGKLVLVDHLGVVQQPDDERALAVIDAAAGEEAQQLLLLVAGEVGVDVFLT